MASNQPITGDIPMPKELKVEGSDVYKLSNELHGFSKKIIENTISSFTVVRILYLIAFAVGFVFIIAAMILAIYAKSPEDIVLPAIFGSGGITELTILLYKPAKEIQRSRANSSQLMAAFSEYQFISMWSGKTYDELLKKLIKNEEVKPQLLKSMMDILKLKKDLTIALVRVIQETVGARGDTIKSKDDTDQEKLKETLENVAKEKENAAKEADDAKKVAEKNYKDKKNVAKKKKKAAEKAKEASENASSSEKEILKHKAAETEKESQQAADDEKKAKKEYEEKEKAAKQKQSDADDAKKAVKAAKKAFDELKKQGEFNLANFFIRAIKNVTKE